MDNIFLDSESDFNYSGRMADDEDRLIRYVDLCIEGARSGRCYLYLAHPDLIYYTGSDKIYQRENETVVRSNETDEYSVGI